MSTPSTILPADTDELVRQLELRQQWRQQLGTHAAGHDGAAAEPDACMLSGTRAGTPDSGSCQVQGASPRAAGAGLEGGSTGGGDHMADSSCVQARRLAPQGVPQSQHLGGAPAGSGDSKRHEPWDEDGRDAGAASKRPRAQ